MLGMFYKAFGLHRKAAMFGLDARVALAIAGTLAFVGGNVAVDTVNKVQSNSLIMDLREVGNAADKFHVDRGENLESVNSATELGEARKQVSQLVEEEIGKPWRGKYIDYEVDTSQADREILVSDKYDGIELLSLRPDTVWKNETETANSICSSSTKCALWAKAENVKKSVAKSALETINGSADIIDTGSARWDESSGNFYYNLDTSELDLSLFGSGSGDGTWITEPWGPCSVECGSGTQSRTVYCDGSSCSATKPAETQSCNDQDCPQWVTGPWSACSQECDGGKQTRSVSCDGRKCPVATRPAMVQDCNTQQCGLGSWIIGDWGTCSADCDGGTQTRDVACSDKVCNGFRPATSQTCNTDPCGTWTVGTWSACTEVCGGGTQTRTVTCSETLCPGAEPIAEQACNTDPCGVWVVGDWGACSTLCDTEMQTRSVTCSESVCLEVEPVSSQPCGAYTCQEPAVCTDPYVDDGDNCTPTDECRIIDSNNKRTTSCSHNYEQGRSTLVTRFYWGGSSVCSDSKTVYSDSCPSAASSCGVYYISSGQICKTTALSPYPKCDPGYTYNPSANKCLPYTEGTWDVGEWSACSVACGDGTQTRAVTCTGDECLDAEPASTQACNDGPCGTWIAGDWGECSIFCGTGGTRSRDYTCSEAVCLDAMPDTSQSCDGSDSCIAPEACTSPYTVDNGAVCTNPNPVCKYSTTSPTYMVYKNSAGYDLFWNDVMLVEDASSSTFGDYYRGAQQNSSWGSYWYKICKNNDSVNKCLDGYEYSVAEDLCYPVELNNCGVPGCVYPATCEDPYYADGAVCRTDTTCRYSSTSPTYYWNTVAGRSTGYSVITSTIKKWNNSTPETPPGYTQGSKVGEGTPGDTLTRYYKICPNADSYARCSAAYTYDSATDMCLPN